MQPTRFQRLFTDHRPLLFLTTVGAVASLIWSGSILVSTVTGSFWSIGKFIILMTIAVCLGGMLGAAPGGMMLGIFLPWIERRNGAPFREGDEIVILSKRFPGRITHITAVWAERHEVRVELGEIERLEVTDVFSYTDVCRLPSAK